MGMFDGTSFLAAWFCSARQRRSPGVYWSILTPALIPLCRLAVFIELPILSRVVIWRVENRPFEKVIIHMYVTELTALVGSDAPNQLQIKRLPLNITRREGHLPEPGPLRCALASAHRRPLASAKRPA